MEKAILEFIKFIHRTKGSSANTEAAYRRDLSKLAQYLTEQMGIVSWELVTATDLNSYMLYMEREHYASSSVCRAVASIRAFFRYLLKEKKITDDPSEGIRPPHVEKKAPVILSVEEVERLLAMPDTHTPKGMRDKAMLELLYATGMRVSELIGLTMEDCNLKLGYVICRDRTKERIIPFGASCEHALKTYLSKSRDGFLTDPSVDFLFTNVQGKKMTRQGFWKVLKGYALAAGIAEDITPHTLRHSFAAHMLRNGADLQSLSEMLGHSDLSTTQMYANIGIAHMRDVYNKAHPRK